MSIVDQLSYRYKKICKNFKAVEQEKESLANEFSKSHALIDSLNSEMSVFIKKNISLVNDLKEPSQKFSSDNLKSFFLC